jgi:hypothetical protein
MVKYAFIGFKRQFEAMIKPLITKANVRKIKANVRLQRCSPHNGKTVRRMEFE